MFTVVKRPNVEKIFFPSGHTAVTAKELGQPTTTAIETPLRFDLLTKREHFVTVNQCDQIGRFIGLW